MRAVLLAGPHQGAPNSHQPKAHIQDSVGARVVGWMRGGPLWSPAVPPTVSYQILMITLHCHAERMSRSPERSEGEASLCPSRQTLRCAQGDTRVSDTTGLRGQLAMTQRDSNQSNLISLVQAMWSARATLSPDSVPCGRPLLGSTHINLFAGGGHAGDHKGPPIPSAPPSPLRIVMSFAFTQCLWGILYRRPNKYEV